MELKKLKLLVIRNNKIYFKDKMQFFLSLLTPIILIVLFLTFLGNVYKSSLLSFVPEGITLDSSIINAFTSSWLFSSILATSCVTVAFCSNIMVIDKINKANLDFKITPVKKTTIQVSYFVSNFIATFLICFIVFIISLIFFAIIGWYFSFVDVLLILVNIVLGVLMGSLGATIAMTFISSQGALSAVCTLFSAMYGFLCGAYMPISQFSTGIQNFVGFIPGTYITVLLRNFYMRGIIGELGKVMPPETIDGLKQGFDNVYNFFGNEVSSLAMYIIVIATIIVLFSVYVLIVYLRSKKHKHKNYAIKA